MIHSNDRSETECGDFMRIRVEVDVHKPLCRGRRVRFCPDKEGWVSFRYERLPIFYHWCGVLNHDSKECNLWLQSKGELSTNSQEYGSWLRADTTSLLRKKMVRVCGMGASNATSSQGQPAMERPAMNTNTEAPDSVELQQEEQRVSKSNVDGENDSSLVVPITGALSNILSNEEAFQTHLKEIDMELEGHMHTDKGVHEGGVGFEEVRLMHEGGADFEEVRLMVEESSVANISTGGMASSGQPSLDVTKVGSLME